MKITVLNKNTITNGDISLKELETIGEVEYFDLIPEDEVIKVAENSDVIITNKTPITARIMDECKNLKFVTLFATGYNNIDIEYAKEKGIVVSNVPGYSTDAVAQHTFAFILELALNLSKYNSSVMAGDWAACDKFCYFSYPLMELKGKTLGILGFGNIGKKVAEIGKAFGMKIIAFNRSEKKEDGVEFVSKEELFKRSDFLTLHCPLNEGTRDIVNKDSISLMKETAFLINTARGACVNEEALSEALNSGKIAGAAVDALEIEPMKENHPYLKTKNILITPHIAWAPNETREKLIGLVAENIRAFMRGNPINVVNK